MAIPYYRGRDYLRRAIESVLSQDHPGWELVVSDDGGDPEGNVGGLVAAYRDPRLRYLPPTGRPGMARNWNRCLDSARADLVTLLHGDDELLPGYVGGMAAAAERHSRAAILYCNARVIGPSGTASFSFPDFFKRFLRPSDRRDTVLRGEAGLRAVLRGNFIMCPTMCYRLSRLGGRRFATHWRFALDLDLTTGLLLEGQELVGVPDTWYAYRRHQANATIEYTRTLVRFQEESAVYRERTEQSRDRGWAQAAAVGRRQTILKLNVAYCALGDLLAGRWSASRDKLALLRDMFNRTGRPAPHPSREADPHPAESPGPAPGPPARAGVSGR